MPPTPIPCDSISQFPLRHFENMTPLHTETEAIAWAQQFGAPEVYLFYRQSLDPHYEHSILAAIAVAGRPANEDEDMPCGHPRSAVTGTDEGTQHCAKCEEEAREH